MKEQDEIDNLFKSTFEDFAVAPPASVKASVDRSISRMRWKRIIQFSSFFVIFTGLIVAAVLLFSSDDQTVQTTSSNQPLTEDEISSHSSSGDNGETNGASENKQGDMAVSADSLNQAASEKSNEEYEFSQTEQSIQREKELDKVKESRNSVSGKKNLEKENTEKENRLNAVSNKKEKAAKMTSQYSKKNKKTEKSGNISSVKMENSAAFENSEKQKEKQAAPGNKVKENAGGVASEKSQEKSAIANTESKSRFEGNPAKGNTENVTSVHVSKENVSRETKTAETKSSKENGNLAAVKDTSKTLTEIKDSTVAPEPVSLSETKKKQSIPLLLSLHGGPAFGFNSAKSAVFDTKISEKSAYFIQCEAAYYFTPKLAAGTGFGYNTWKENVSKDIHTTADSVITSYTVEYILDTATQTIDSILIPNYQVTPGVDVSLINNYKVYAFTVPVFFNYSHNFSQKLFLDLGVGAILSFQGNRSVTETFGQGANTVHSFGVRAYVRPQLRYQFSAWGVSLITNFGYDITPVNSYQDIKRSRTYLNVGLGLHYKLGK